MSSSLLTFVTLSALSLTSSFQPNSYRSTSLVPMQPISTYDQSSKFSIQRLEPLFSTPKKQNKNEIEPSNTKAPTEGGNFDPLSYIKSKIVREKSFYSDTKKRDEKEITVSKRLSLNAKVLPKEMAEETAQEAEFDPFVNQHRNQANPTA